jgi:TPR repeat protein
LGEFYYDGKNAPRDLNQALSYFEKASLQGHAQAQFKLGTMFFHGEGVQANNIQAYIVLKMAAVNGAEDALDTADEVSEKMSAKTLRPPRRCSGKFSVNT